MNLIQEIVKQSIDVKRQAFDENDEKIEKVIELLVDALKSGKKLLICGNGGSAADSQHIAAEFIGRFKKERKALPAIALSTDTSILTSLSNDYNFDIIFSRQIEALGQEGDVLLGISTSGNSQNVVKAVEAAKQQGMTTVVLTGDGGGKLGEIADICIAVPSKITARIQESHITIAHVICELVENKF